MKRILVLLFLVLCGGVVMAQTEPGFTWAGFPSIGPRDIATPTFSVPRNVAVPLPTLPEGTKKFRVSAWGGDLLAGHQNDIATTTPGVGIKISAGSSFEFETSTTTPTWYFIASGAANATGVVDAAW